MVFIKHLEYELRSIAGRILSVQASAAHILEEPQSLQTFTQ